MRDPSHEDRKTTPRLQVEIVSQDETKAHDPFWDGPRLKPAFVTQLLGQVMAGEHHAAPRRVYGETETSQARLFDARV